MTKNAKKTSKVSKMSKAKAKVLTTPRQRASMLKQIAETWDLHPEWGIGKLISSAASISRGELRLNPNGITDKEIMSGLKALIPADWENQK